MAPLPYMLSWKLANRNFLNSTGLADEIIAKQEQVRGRKRDLDDEEYGQSPKRPRSLSSRSSISVSTISTYRSRSGSPEYRTKYSRPRDEEHEQGPSASITNKARQRKRRYSDDSASDSSASVEQPRRSRDVSRSSERNTRRKRREYSPPERGRKRDSSITRGSRRYQSQSPSQERSRIARERHSMTPSTLQRRRSPHPSDRAAQRGGEPQRAPRDRSLSPFSKRLALTQAMNMGR